MLPKSEHRKVEGRRNFSIKANKRMYGTTQSNEITDSTERDRNTKASMAQMQACNDDDRDETRTVESSANQAT
jgi:hypothetical protein